MVVEIYSTGRANLPGATSYRELLEGYAPCVAEIRKYSSAAAGDGMSGSSELTIETDEPSAMACTRPAEEIDDLFADWG